MDMALQFIETPFRSIKGIQARAPDRDDYKLVRALTMDVDPHTKSPKVKLDKFINEIYKGLSIDLSGHVREIPAMSSSLIVNGTRTIMASQMYESAYDEKKYTDVKTYGNYYIRRFSDPSAQRITWLGSPAMVFSYKNRATLEPYLNGLSVINLMFWITSFNTADCYNEYSKNNEEQPGYLRSALLKKINENKDRSIRESDKPILVTKYIFAFDIDDTLYKQNKEINKGKGLIITDETDEFKEFRRNIIDKMKTIINSENYIWIITANNYPKYEFVNTYFDADDRNFFSKSEYFYYMNNTNIPLIYEDAKNFFPEEFKDEYKFVINKVHEKGHKPYALYAQTLIEKYNYNTRHPDNKIDNFKIYLFDDNKEHNLKENCEKFDITLKLVTDFDKKAPPVPVLDDFLTAILDDENIYELSKKTQETTQETTQEITQETKEETKEETRQKKKELDAVALYCNKYGALQDYCKKPKYQKYNTYKNYYENNKDETKNKDGGEFLTNFEECIERVKKEDEYLGKFNSEAKTNYYLRYNEMFSYIYPWDIEGIEIGSLSEENFTQVKKEIETERYKIVAQLEKMILNEDNIKDSIRRMNMIIYTIINNLDYANIIYDYINNKKKQDLKITHTLFLLTKLILLSKCNMNKNFNYKEFEFSSDTENITNLINEIIKIMKKPLEIFEYVLDEESGLFEMKKITSNTKRSKNLTLFQLEDEATRERYQDILITKKSNLQLTGAIGEPLFMRDTLSSTTRSAANYRLKDALAYSVAEKGGPAVTRRFRDAKTFSSKITGGIKRTYRKNKYRKNKYRKNKSKKNKSKKNKSRKNKSKKK
jgi:hypothetical protein